MTSTLTYADAVRKAKPDDSQILEQCDAGHPASYSDTTSQPAPLSIQPLCADGSTLAESSAQPKPLGSRAYPDLSIDVSLTASPLKESSSPSKEVPSSPSEKGQSASEGDHELTESRRRSNARPTTLRQLATNARQAKTLASSNSFACLEVESTEDDEDDEEDESDYEKDDSDYEDDGYSSDMSFGGDSYDEDQTFAESADNTEAYDADDDTTWDLHSDTSEYQTLVHAPASSMSEPDRHASSTFHSLFDQASSDYPAFAGPLDLDERPSNPPPSPTEQLGFGQWGYFDFLRDSDAHDFETLMQRPANPTPNKAEFQVYVWHTVMNPLPSHSESGEIDHEMELLASQSEAMLNFDMERIPRLWKIMGWWDPAVAARMDA